MKRKSLLYFSLTLFIFITSCSNVYFQETSDENSISFTLGKAAAGEIINSVSQSSEVTDDSLFEIKCSLQGTKIPPQNKNVKKSELPQLTFTFEELPFDTEFNVLIEVSFNNIVIYQGKSDKITLTQQNFQQNVNISIEKVKSKISYENNGGIVKQPETVIKEYFINDKISSSNLPVPEKNGFTFEGWYFDEECKKPVTELGQKEFLGNITLYAKYISATYKIKYNLSSPDAENNNNPETYVYGSNITLNPPIRKGYTGKWLVDGVEQDTIKEDTFGDITFTADFTPIKYTVTFRGNEGTGTLPEDIECTYDVGITLPSYNLTKSGYETQNKWNTSADGKGTSYDAGSSTKVKNLSSTNNSTVTLYAQWTDIAPGEVSELTARTGDKEITITWKDPSDTDFSKVLITPTDKQPLEITKGKGNAVITGLQNGKKYSVKIQTVDINGNTSTGTNTFSFPMNSFTETPQDVGTKSVGGKTFQLVKFGDYPQTLYDSSKVTLSTNTTTIHGWTCKFGSDGYYYAEVAAAPHSTINNFTSGTTYYFKLEPILWRVLTNNYGGKKLLLAEKALLAKRIFSKKKTRTIDGKTIYPNNYEHSEIVGYLNNEFLSNTFTTNAISKIQEITIRNDAASTMDVAGSVSEATECVCNNTNNKVFLLSLQEATTPEYGFNNNAGQADPAKAREGTDYARATGISMKENKYWWWLRSPMITDANCRMRYINYDTYANGGGNGGSINANSGSSVPDSDGGIVPAITINN